MEQNLNSISQQIKEKGVVSVSNLLSSKDLEDILSIVKQPLGLDNIRRRP